MPLTVTDTGMVRYWITMAHAATLAAHGALLAGEGTLLAGPADPSMLTVGELAERIWRGAGREGEPDIDLVGIRRGETLSEVLTAPGEELGDERLPGDRPDPRRDLHGRSRLGRRAAARHAAAARRRGPYGSRRCNVPGLLTPGSPPARAQTADR